MFTMGAEALKAALPHLAEYAAKGATIGDVINHVSGGGYGGRNQNGQNVEFAQSQTQPGYDAARDNTRSANDDLMIKMAGMNDTAFYRGKALGDHQRQSDFVNNIATTDQSNRAALAQSAIQSYDNARQANAQFLSTLNNAGMGRAY